MRLLIIRHGDPDYEHDTLTEKGRREAALLAERLAKEKIDYIYASPLGRAKDTCMYTARRIGMEDKVIVKPWLREFSCPHTLPSGEKKSIVWDMLPSFWTNEEKLFDRNAWQEQDFFKEADVKKAYAEVTDGLDELLAAHGYVREGAYYKAVRSNRDTVALFCHFGLEMMLLSRLLNISPIVLTHQFVALTSSVTTLYTEERREGAAAFRCCGFGDTGHLYAGGETPSFSARFCEVYNSDERHD